MFISLFESSTVYVIPETVINEIIMVNRSPMWAVQQFFRRFEIDGNNGKFLFPIAFLRRE